MQDLVCSRHLVLQCEYDEYLWDDFCAALEVCIFYPVHGYPASIGLFNVVVANYLRQRLHSSTNESLSFEEMVIAMQYCKHLATDPRDQVFTLYSVLGGEAWAKKAAKRVPHIDYSLPVQTVYVEAAKALGPLSLSLVEAPEAPSSAFQDTRTPSWVPNWGVPRSVFLLNHPKSHFSASARIMDEIPSTKGRDDFPRFSWEGIQVDTIKDVSEYLPPRRHRDHFNVSGMNTLIYDQWFEFARDHTTRSLQHRDDSANVLLHYAETIQARGCNSIWEANVSEDPKVLMKGTQDFLNFLQIEVEHPSVEVQMFYAACFPSHGRRFGITRRGHFCLVPRDTRQGDLVCILNDNRVPVLFRRMGKEYMNMGECYVHGLMQDQTEDFNDCKPEVFEVI